MSAFLSKRLSLDRKPAVVRNLFGAIDDNERENLRVQLDRQLKEIDLADRQRFISKWDFDPVKDEPVGDSKFEYTQVDGKSLPAMYTAPYRRKPHLSCRPRVRSPCITRNILPAAASRPAKRKLRFDNESHSDSNDENREVAEPEDGQQPKHPRTVDTNQVGYQDLTHGTITTVNDILAASSLTSPPASPQVSSLYQSHCPSSPSVLSSSCPPVLDSESVHKRLEFPVDVPGLSRSFSESSFQDLDLSRVSPSRQALDYVTPSVPSGATGRLVQRVMTDYIPIKKKRTVKSTPRS